MSDGPVCCLRGGIYLRIQRELKSWAVQVDRLRLTPSLLFARYCRWAMPLFQLPPVKNKHGGGTGLPWLL